MKGVIVTIFVGALLLTGFVMVYIEVMIGKSNKHGRKA